MRLCVHWPTFGPYHIARLRAAMALGRERGVEVVGVEIARTDQTYGFAAPEGFDVKRRTLFSDEPYEVLNPARIRKHLIRTLTDLDPDGVAITSYASPDARAALEWCRAKRRAAILMTATKADDAKRIGWREAVKRILVRGYDAALVGGTPQEAYLRELGFPGSEIFHGYNVVDNDHFSRKQNGDPSVSLLRQTVSDHHPFFLAAGRMTTRKNYFTLLRAYAQYRKMDQSPWRLVILGDGPLRHEIEAFVSGKSIDGVWLAGFRHYHQLPVFYQEASAFVHPAAVDQWGLVVNEAMAAGLPVIVSSGAGCTSELVAEGENGHLFDPADAAQLAKLLVQMSESTSRLAQMAGRSRDIISAWSPERFGRSLFDAFDLGLTKRNRSFSPVLRLTLGLIGIATTSTTSFHSVDP